VERTGTECQEEVFHRASKNKEIEEVLPSSSYTMPWYYPHGLLLGCMAGVLKRVEAEVRESAKLWYVIDFVTTTPDA